MSLPYVPLLSPVQGDPIPTTQQPGPTYTLAMTDAGSCIDFLAPCSVYVPTHAAVPLPIGTTICLCAAPGAVTVNPVVASVPISYVGGTTYLEAATSLVRAVPAGVQDGDKLLATIGSPGGARASTWATAGPGVIVDWAVVDANNIVVTPAVPMATNAYRIVVTG